MTSRFVKQVSSPRGYIAWEAAGLRWLAAADAVPVAEVLDIGADRLVLRRLTRSGPTRDGAEALGAGLARLHAAGASGWGVAPDGWDSDGWLGPSNDVLPLRIGAYATWGAMYADARLLPALEIGESRGRLGPQDRAMIERVADRLRAGVYDTDDRPARLHGDLWSGNVMWTDDGAVLIDPAAHGGHRETDLAMLAIFGAPHLDRLLGAYDEVAPLASGWPGRVGLHQLHPLLVHAALFGGTYAAELREVARRYA